MTATNIVPSTGQADTMIRSGYLALRAIADFYRIPPERVPSDPGELSVTRADFEQALDQLEREGIEINADRATAWAAFRGWRVNYDNAIGGLRELISDPLPHWMSHQPGAPEANSA